MVQDGRSLLPLVVGTKSGGSDGSGTGQGSSAAAWRTELLMEYTGGDVIRFNHTEDAFNNSFRALRVIDANGTDLLYSEFTDCRTDWNFTSDPLEVELFNLTADPWQMVNLALTAPDAQLAPLRRRVRELYVCTGETCN